MIKKENIETLTDHGSQI